MKKKLCAGLTALVMTISTAGCGTSMESTLSASNSKESEITQDKTAVESDKQEEAEEDSKDDLQKSEKERELAEQYNSFSIMYYLAITAEEIRTSKDNRLILEEIYTSLLNDVNPGSVDEITQDHLRNLRDIIKSYLNISIKRERLQFIYNQEKAAAMRSAVPNPLAVLSVSNVMDWKKMALTVAYTAVDSYNNYKRAGESADIAFIMSGWELDDEEKEIVMRNRDRAFDYMVDMVQEYKLDGLKTLNEKEIEKFVEISKTQNSSERIKLLRAEESKYSLLGNYWLELADAYFETSQYSKCLECVEEYKNLATDIYRQDFNYLKILPKAVVAAQEIYTGKEYLESITGFVDAIINNTSTDDWSIRYFAAQVYLDLYAKTNEQQYLDKAYKIASENVTVLLKEQRTINKMYLADVAEQTSVEPDYSYMTETEKKEAKREYKEEQKRIKEYNKALKKNRKTELPALYEPLVLNCELLFALANKMDVDGFEKAEIEAILGTAENNIFMVKPINATYSFTDAENKNPIEFLKDEIIIPVNLLTAGSKVVVTVNEKGTETLFDDFVVTKVEREGSTIDTFKAYVSGKMMKKYQWTADSKIIVTITYSDAYDKKANYEFEVSTFEEHFYGDKVEFRAR